jgi:hypothetical protein
MTTELAAAEPTRAATSGGVRVLLLGRPAAGKSSLLDALARTGERPPDAVLIDCDGQAAGDLIAANSVEDTSSALAGEVRSADTIVFLVDASENAEQFEADLSAAQQFLRRFQAERGQNLATGGLPVLLALSKCDRLATPGDSPKDWTERIEQKKRDVGDRFRTFVRNHEILDFGDLDLTVAATAIRRPALARETSQASEPWGVTELFRDAVSAAAEFRNRQRRARVRLAGMTLSTIGIMVLLATAGAALFIFRESLPAAALAAKVESYKAREGPSAATRLAEPLPRKASELADIASDAEFPNISAELRGFVQGRQAEMTEYRSYKDRLGQLSAPIEARSEEELDECERRLRDKALPPEPYAGEWRPTDAVLLRQKWLDDIRSLRAAAVAVADWYRELTTRADRLLATNGADWPRWQADVTAVFHDADSPPFQAKTPLRDSRAFGKAQAATYGSVLPYPAVADAREAWFKKRGALERLRDVSVALGLADNGPALLKLTDQFAVADARGVLTALKATYPRSNEWTLRELSEAAARAVRPSLQVNTERVIEAGRLDIARRARNASDPLPQRLRSAVAEFAAAPELREWRELVSTMGRWLDIKGDDPVTALAAFLQYDHFDVNLSGLRLEIPDDLKENRLRPQGNLVISVQQPGQAMNTIRFRLADEGTRDPSRRITTYSFVAEESDRLVVRPGDVIWAEVTVRDSVGQAWTLSWWANGIRSPAYQFDRLTLPPRIHRSDQKPEEGAIAAGVALAFTPERGWPRLPDLFPAMR